MNEEETAVIAMSPALQDYLTRTRKGSYETLNVYFWDNIVGTAAFCNFPNPDLPVANYWLDGCHLRSNTLPGGTAKYRGHGTSAVRKSYPANLPSIQFQLTAAYVKQKQTKSDTGLDYSTSSRVDARERVTTSTTRPPPRRPVLMEPVTMARILALTSPVSTPLTTSWTIQPIPVETSSRRDKTFACTTCFGPFVPGNKITRSK